MYIEHLSLANFRNYGRLEAAFAPGPTVLFGPNAQGKTNVLEAVYYLATTRSPQADQDQQLINWHADVPDEPVVVGRVIADVVTASASHQVALRLIKERQGGATSFRREALVNRRKVRLMDLLGQLRVVLFLPQDIQLITGPPSARRRYLDITLCQVDSNYCRQLSGYNKVLEQRNAQLRLIAEHGHGRDVLPVFDERLIKLGAAIFARRATFLAELGRHAARIHYEQLTEESETIRLLYLPSLRASGRRAANGAGARRVADGTWLLDAATDVDAVADRFAAELSAVTESDIGRSATSVGPHRDDWQFHVNGRSLARFGSRGQQRTALLALKLAEILWMEGETGEKPVLLLDDVTAELDARRRAALLAAVAEAEQALLTATTLEMFTPEFLSRATQIAVDEGQLQVTATHSLT